MTDYWGASDFLYWISSGCDKKSAAGVVYLRLFNYVPTGGVLQHFVNLCYLDLSYCGLTTIPEDVWELTKLKGLNVGYNSICEISPKIKNLTNLEHFSCVSNNLTALPVEICQLTKLIFFGYSGNKLDVLDPSVVDFIRVASVNMHGV